MTELQRSTKIEIDSNSSTPPILLCPRCQSRNLHHAKVTTFNRSEDEETVVVSSTEDKTTRTDVLPNHLSGNPSSRRDGLAIRFWCENCGGQSDDDIIELTIAQHKGDTLVEWRFTPIVTKQLMNAP
jgi:hypothetical protein